VQNVGHQWTLSTLLPHLGAQGIDIAFLMQNIEEVVVKAIIASAPFIISACHMFVLSSLNILIIISVFVSLILNFIYCNIR
jgi:hypothetical protein